MGIFRKDDVFGAFIRKQHNEMPPQGDENFLPPPDNFKTFFARAVTFFAAAAYGKCAKPWIAGADKNRVTRRERLAINAHGER
jgi:hypothetical protein